MDDNFLVLQRALAGEYSLEREIGRGGMGIVYLARDVQLDRLVAIKVLPAALAARDEVRERFIREARTAAGLSHPNIVPIHRVGEAENLPYFVMTFVRGETLGERLRSRGPMTPTALTRMMHDVALALGYAHGRGVIHRDVKPDNILLEEESGRALVTDFGIASHLADDAEEQILGTVQFMSPEQARGERLDGRSDVYSLGVVAYLAATGSLPHESNSATGLLARIATTQAPKVGAPGVGLPAGMARVIDRCLRLDREERFKTAESIASALDASIAPVRAALPEAIREWTSTPTPLLNVYGFWSAGWFIAAANEYAEWVSRGAMYSGFNDHRLNNSIVGITLAALPILPIGLFQLMKTRRALGAGYTIADLRRALADWVVKRREELDRAREPWWGRGLRRLAWFAAISVPSSIIGMETVRNPGGPMTPDGLVAIVYMTMIAGIVSVTTMNALGLPLISPAIERDIVGSIRSRLWNSRVGGWLAKWITPRERGVPETNFRPTELALKLAVEDLYAALPQAYRELIGDLPPVAARLSAHVTELRTEVERLELVRSEARETDSAAVERMLVASRQQLGQTVGALERMRLELLRLHGGSTDGLRELTTSLDVARVMVEDIVRLRGAEEELDPRRRAPAIDLRSPSPA